MIWRSVILYCIVTTLDAQTIGLGMGGGFYGGLQPAAGPSLYGQPSPLMTRQSPLIPGSMMRPVVSQDDMMLSPSSPLQMAAYPGVGVRGFPGMGMGSPMGSPALMSQMNPYDAMLARRSGMVGMGGNSLHGEGMSPYSFGGRPGGMDFMQQYPGGDREMFGESGPGGPQYGMGGMGMRGDGPPGVSFYPFARIRPGPGLVIVNHAKDQDVGADQVPLFPAPFNSNETETENTDAIFDALNRTEEVTVSSLNSTTPTTLTTRPSTISGNSTVPTTVNAGSITVTFGANTTPPPCAHPVYMNRVFMSTALSMGLISANTSCVVLLDH